MEEVQIEQGKIYLVVDGQTRFKVKAIKPAFMAGWWVCRQLDPPATIVVPSKRLCQLDAAAPG